MEKSSPNGLFAEPNRYVLSNRGWYYECEASSFHGFLYHPEADSLPESLGTNIWGPFRTLAEAKTDAIEYYNVNIHYARIAIKDIKAWRKNK